MNAQELFDSAPLGSLVRFSNGHPRPPEHHRRKLRAWREENGEGRFVERTARRHVAAYQTAASFTLHLGNHGRDGTILLVVRRIYTVESQLDFRIAERPRPGMVRILTPIGDGVELRFLARDMAEAEAWMAVHHYSAMTCETVSEDEAGCGLGVAGPEHEAAFAG
jgi:hypothetical protein